MDSNILYSTLLLALLFGCVVYASATPASSGREVVVLALVYIFNDDIYVSLLLIPVLLTRINFNHRLSWLSPLSPVFKGTQDWDFFWLRFWNLYYFFVSYVKILRFYKKKFLIGPFWGEVRFFRVVLGLRGIKIVFNLGQQNFFLSTSYMTPLYLLKIVFPKFDPLTASGTAFSVNLGQKCQNLFPLVWD